MRTLTGPARTSFARGPQVAQRSAEGTVSFGGGSPRVLFIGCADFRVSGSAALGVDADEVVEARSAGPVVPRYRRGGRDGVAASIEWAVTKLGVEEIVLCGHADCSAVRSLWDDAPAGHRPSARAWRKMAAPHPSYFDGEVPGDEERVREAERRHLLTQMHHLRTYPCVTRRLVSRRLRVSTWYHTGRPGEVQCWDAENGTFREL